MMKTLKWPLRVGPVGALALAAVLLATVTPAHASGAALQETFSFLCLDANIAYGGLFDGDNAQGWGCNGWDNQDWLATYGALPGFSLHSRYPGNFCLDADVQYG